MGQETNASGGFVVQPAGGEIGRRSLDGATVQNKYIEHGAYCDRAPNAGGCSLDPGTRGRLIGAYQQNVLAAQIQFGDALTELHLEALIEKPEELPIWVSLAFDAAGILAGQLVTKVLTKFRTAAPAALDALGVMAGDPEKQATFMDAIRGSDPTALASIGLAQAKKAATATAQTDDAQQRVSYLKYLSDTSAVAFERQRQDPPGYANDAELVVLLHAWSAAMGMTKEQFKSAISAKTDRYKKSAAAKVGKKKKVSPDGRGSVFRDTQLIAIMPSDDESAPEMWLYKKDRALTPSSMLDADDRRDDPMEVLNEIDETFVRWTKVEPEFLNEAMLANQQAWGVPYEKRYDVAAYVSKINGGP